MKIWKYPLIDPEHFREWPDIWMQKGAKILYFGNQHGVPTIWALVDPEAELEMRHFRLANTGDALDVDSLEINETGYIGTALFREGDLVLHLFEEP